MSGLNADQLTQLEEEGYLVLPGLLSPDEVMETSTNLLRLLEEAGEDLHHPNGLGISYEDGFEYQGKSLEERDLGIRKYQSFAERDQFFWDSVRNPKIKSIMESIFEPGIGFAQSMALVKAPKVGTEKPWHQDVAYFPVEPKNEMVGLWIALDDATEENGCMQVIPGTHTQGLLPHVTDHLQLPPEAIESRRDDVVMLPMPAGSGMVFNSNLFHYTGHNHSEARRRALQYHYVSSRTRYVTDADGRQVFSLDLEDAPLASVRSDK